MNRTCLYFVLVIIIILLSLSPRRRSPLLVARCWREMYLIDTPLTWTSHSLLIATVAGTVFAAAVLLNVLAQLLFKNPNEPPVVFHWVPFLGSTIAYGIDPYKFFFACREKVCKNGWYSVDGCDEWLTLI